MTKILNHINTYADLTAYNNDMSKDFPNISYIQGTDEVKWEKTDPYINVCKYNVTSTSEATKLLDSNSNIAYQIIDGVRQDTVQTTYTFDTLGEHTVKYKLNGTSIDDMVFSNCDRLTSITIPDSVTSIGQGSFYGCTGITSIIIPNSVTSISQNAFYNCGLTSVTIPDSITSISQFVFGSCKSLTSAIIPNSVTSIGNYVFNGCSGLTSVTIEAINPPTLGNGVFTSTNNYPIYVPAESVSAYKAASNWSSLASRIKPIS